MYTFTDFDPLAAIDAAWSDYLRLRAGESRLQVQEAFARKRIRCVLVYQDTALLFAVRSFAMVVEVDGRVDDPFALMAALSRLAVGGFLITTKDVALQSILSGWGGQVVNAIDYFLLERADADVGIWLSNEAASGLSVTRHRYVPESMLEEVASLMTLSMNDIMRSTALERFRETAEGLGRKMTLFRQTGVEMVLFLLADAGGPVGLSFVLVTPGSPVARQEHTGIARQYRGKRLAHFLKALTIRETFASFPEVRALTTNCYSANLPILHINRAMGYVFVDRALQYRVTAPSP